MISPIVGLRSNLGVMRRLAGGLGILAAGSMMPPPVFADAPATVFVAPAAVPSPAAVMATPAVPTPFAVAVPTAVPSPAAVVPPPAIPSPDAVASPQAIPTPAAATKLLALQDVVRLALDHNSAIVIARERLKKAEEQITQVDAQARPQIRADITDSLSSQPSFGGAGGGAASAPTLPGGGGIPTVIDQGGGNLGTFVGGGSTSPGNVAPATTTTPSTQTSPTSPTSPTGSTTPTGPANPIIVPPSANGGTITPHATTTGGGQTFTGGNYNNYGARISLSQYVDLYGLVPTARSVERITRDYYALDLDRQSNELALSAKNAYFNVLRAQASLDVQHELVASARESLRIAEARFNAGVAANFDVVTARTALANAEQSLSSAQNQLDLANANLNNLIGSSLDTPLALEIPVTSTDLTIDLDKAVAAANSGRPELKQADNNIVIARKLIKLAGATLKPTLGITGSANFSGTAVPGSPKDTYSVSADIGMPLYDGGATHSRVRSAESDLTIQTVTRDQLRQNVALEVRQAYLNVNDAKARIGSATVGATQAAEALRLANVRYQNGIGTFLEVTNAQSQLATARLNLLSAKYDYETSLAQLARAEGTR